ncbi:unnamed protein product [Nesidiocoris tenuis]|uniref:Uncharacterized protein n=1 Tax=Nesidiocoris tenuis TaxID=355587 RepID=A0A6H5GJ07_9HEMI|nr:unnamed protein product [Nesidiocoris tenuis]
MFVSARPNTLFNRNLNNSQYFRCAGLSGGPPVLPRHRQPGNGSGSARFHRTVQASSYSEEAVQKLEDRALLVFSTVNKPAVYNLVRWNAPYNGPADAFWSNQSLVSQMSRVSLRGAEFQGTLKLNNAALWQFDVWMHIKHAHVVNGSIGVVLKSRIGTELYLRYICRLRFPIHVDRYVSEQSLTFVFRKVSLHRKGSSRFLGRNIGIETSKIAVVIDTTIGRHLGTVERGSSRTRHIPYNNFPSGVSILGRQGSKILRIAQFLQIFQPKFDDIIPPKQKPLMPKIPSRWAGDVNIYSTGHSCARRIRAIHQETKFEAKPQASGYLIVKFT